MCVCACMNVCAEHPSLLTIEIFLHILGCVRIMFLVKVFNAYSLLYTALPDKHEPAHAATDCSHPLNKLEQKTLKNVQTLICVLSGSGLFRPPSLLWQTCSLNSAHCGTVA